ncbi:MAG: hypothetical protein K1X79_06055 [Oligoflexia bacterium]|nr:hypothetical protein [Oligoflexia bacterium]
MYRYFISASLLLVLSIALPCQAQYLAGEAELAPSIKSSKTALAKPLAISSKLSLSRKISRLNRASKNKRQRTSGSQTPTIKSFVPASPVDFAKLTPDAKGYYVFKIIGQSFSKDMSLLATYKDSKRKVIVPFKLISSSSISFKTSSVFSALVNFTLIKSVGGMVLESNTVLYAFLDSSGGGKGETPTPTATGTATPPGNGTPTPGPTNTPTATPTVVATSTSTPTPQPTPIVSNPGDHIATIETDANSAAKFVLHAVLPIPRKKITEAQIKAGQSFLAVEDANGTLIPGQIEVVTKNAGASLGDTNPDVAEVEVIAEVSQQAGQTRPRYRVFEASSTQPARPVSGYSARSVLYSPPFLSEGTVTALFDAPGKIVLRAHDIFGNSYSADLTEQSEGLPKIIKYGAHQIQVRTFNIMRPDVVVSGPTGTYPRLFGVHAYFTISKETKALKLDLKIGNTLAGLNTQQSDDDFIKEFYYQDLNLEVGATGWDIKHLFPTLYDGTSYNSAGKTIMPLVVPMPGNKPHYMPRLKNLLLRTALFPNIAGGATDADILVMEKGLGFSVKGVSANHANLQLFSYFNPGLASYLPQGTYIPELTHVSGGLAGIRSNFQSDLNKFSNLISQERCNSVWKVTNGVGAYECNYPVVCGVNPLDPNDPNDHLCGPISAWGVTYGGMTSGTETSKVEGAIVASAASLEGYRWLLLQHKERTQRNDQFHKRDGEVVFLRDLEKSSTCGIIAPIDYFNTLNTSQMDPFGANQSPTAMRSYAVANNLQPDYEFFWDTSLPSSYDNEDGQHSVRYQRTNDALTWLGNDSVAKDSTLAAAAIVTFQHPHRPIKCNGTAPVFDSQDVYRMAPSVPGTGVSIGREEAHMWNTLASAYAVGDSSLRSYLRPPYFDYVVDNVLAAAQIPSLGFISKNNNYSKNSPVGRCWTVAVNEEGFLQIANISIRRRVYDGADSTHSNLMQGMITNEIYANMTSQLAWADGSGNNVPNWFKTHYRVPIAEETQPAAIFADWSNVPVDCQNDSNSMGASFGEYLFGFSQVREWTGDPSISAAASSHLNHNSTASLLSKLQAVSLSNLESGIHLSLLACAQQGKC